jgi:hypothetical protein
MYPAPALSPRLWTSVLYVYLYLVYPWPLRPSTYRAGHLSCGELLEPAEKINNAPKRDHQLSVISRQFRLLTYSSLLRRRSSRPAGVKIGSTRARIQHACADNGHEVHAFCGILLLWKRTS